MCHPRRFSLPISILVTTLGVLLISSNASAQRGSDNEAFESALRLVTNMPTNTSLRSRASERGLDVLNVLWEDTARSGGSAYGPNISDVTLQVLSGEGDDRQAHLLPVLRFPNFTDRTADLRMEDFWIRVGNEIDGEELRAVPLYDVLSDLGAYLSNPPDSPTINLTAERDTHVLVSAQHVFLPVPQAGEATFTPVIFNYQSAPSHPAVLTLLVTREGTSVTVIENRYEERSSYGGGQQLFYNAAGERAPFTAERLSDVRERITTGQAREADAGALDPGADVLLFIQVPLVHANQGFLEGLDGIDMFSDDYEMMPMAAEMETPSDVEQAVLGHGETEGPFVELNGLTIERDDRFPIRVTVQFYRATSNGVVSDDDLDDVRAQIEQVYEQGDYVGSLVVPEGERVRPTDWIRTNPGGDTWQGPRGWWFRENR